MCEGVCEGVWDSVLIFSACVPYNSCMLEPSLTSIIHMYR